MTWTCLLAWGVVGVSYVVPRLILLALVVGAVLVLVAVGKDGGWRGLAKLVGAVLGVLAVIGVGIGGGLLSQWAHRVVSTCPEHRR